MTVNQVERKVLGKNSSLEFVACLERAQEAAVIRQINILPQVFSVPPWTNNSQNDSTLTFKTQQEPF